MTTMTKGGGKQPVALAALAIGATVLWASPAGSQCNINFNDPAALSVLTDGLGGFNGPDTFAGRSFAFTPHYRQACGCCNVGVTPSVWEHYHLTPEDPGIGHSYDTNGDGQFGDPNCTCFSPLSTPSNGYGKELGCPPTSNPTCTPVDMRQQPRTLTPHDEFEILHVSAPTYRGGATVGALCILDGSIQACLSGEGEGFRPQSVEVIDGTANFVGLFVTTQRIQVSTNPPVFVTVPILAARAIGPFGPGTVNLSGLGTIVRMLVATPGGSRFYTFDNLRVEMAALVLASEASPEWFGPSGAPLPTNSANVSYGTRSNVLPAPGFNLVTARTIDTSTLPQIGTRVAVDVFIPTAQSNPNWVGDIQLFVTVPSANVFNKALGTRTLTEKPRGQWSSVSFDVDAQLRGVLLEQHNDVSFALGVNLASALQPTLIDDFHFEGDIVVTPRCGDGVVNTGEECDDHNTLSGDGCSASCRIEAPGACSEQSSVDLGPVNSVSAVPSNACLKVTQYPGTWVHAIELQSQAGSGYPVPFSWSNCSTTGQGSFAGSWTQQSLRTVNSTCTTLIRLQGSGAQNIQLAWWGNG